MKIKSVFNKSLSLFLALVILITSAAVFAPAQAKTIINKCTYCNGKGYYLCKACRGSGKSKYWDVWVHTWKYYDCPACDGYRYINCPRCQNGYEVIEIPEPKPTSIKKIVPKAVGFTVSWKRQTVQTAGYEVQYATDSKFKNKDYELISGNANTSVTISGLKANKKYYVRVRSYKTAYGRRYSSSWSGVKSVVTKKLAKPPKTSISKIVAKSAAFTVSWKKQTKNTTGYQIQYATNSKFKSGKKKAVTGKTSLTISKLTGGKKYYVRVRTYRKYGGNYYFSAWSGAKSVVTKVITKPTTPVITGFFTESYNAGGLPAPNIYIKKVKGCTGYQMQVSTVSNFKTGSNTILDTCPYNNSSGRAYCSKNKWQWTLFSDECSIEPDFDNNPLKCDTTYYFRIRTYKKANGKTYYSKWSKTLSGYWEKPNW